MLKTRKAQSTLEYIIVLTAIVAGILVVSNNVIRGRMENMLTHVSDQAQTAVQRIDFGAAQQPNP